MYSISPGFLLQGDIANEFRVKHLGLPPLNTLPRCHRPLAFSSDIQHTYCWSRQLFPKPADYGQNIEVVGFCSPPALKSEAPYSPSPELKGMLSAADTLSALKSCISKLVHCVPSRILKLVSLKEAGVILLESTSCNLQILKSLTEYSFGIV